MTPPRRDGVVINTNPLGVMSKMWERRIRDLTNKIETLEKHHDALQESFDRMLFPTESLSNEIATSEGLLVDLKGSLAAVQAQDVLQDQEELRRAESPLQPSRNRDGFFRDGKTRVEAILGILERERRLNAPLTREAFSRAQSTDASSFRFRASYGSRFQPSYSDFEYDPDTGEVIAGKPFAKFDPCVEWRTVQKMRRAVMFAQGSAGRGHRGLGRRSLKPPGC